MSKKNPSNSLKTWQVFISRPFDKVNEKKKNKYWESFYKKAIYPCEKILNDRGFNVKFYNAPANPTAMQIAEKIPLALRNSDIFVCVLTGFRPNVLFEVGYARSLGLPCVFLIDKDSFEKPFPILVGTPDQIYYDPEKLKETAFKLSRHMMQAYKLARINYEEKIGMHHRTSYQIKCYKDRASLDLPKKIKEAKSSIKILTTNVHYFINEPFNKAPGDKSKIEYLQEAIKKNVSVEVLTMNPDANLVIERSKQIEPQHKEDVYKYRKELRNGIKRFYQAFKKSIAAGKLSFRLYSSLPTQMIYWIDDTLYLSTMASHSRSRKCVHIEFKTFNPGVENTFIHNFELVSRESVHINQFTWILEPYN